MLTGNLCYPSETESNGERVERKTNPKLSPNRVFRSSDVWLGMKSILDRKAGLLMLLLAEITELTV